MPPTFQRGKQTNNISEGVRVGSGASDGRDSLFRRAEVANKHILTFDSMH